LNYAHRNIRLGLAAATLVVASAFSTAPAVACPYCKFANEEKQKGEATNPRPQAYMYSILFMLSMPASLLGAFGYGFYRLWKKQQLLTGGNMLISEFADPEDASPGDG
jgi:hypothetical protein